MGNRWGGSEKERGIYGPGSNRLRLDRCLWLLAKKHLVWKAMDMVHCRIHCLKGYNTCG